MVFRYQGWQTIYSWIIYFPFFPNKFCFAPFQCARLWEICSFFLENITETILMGEKVSSKMRKKTLKHISPIVFRKALTYYPNYIFFSILRTSQPRMTVPLQHCTNNMWFLSCQPSLVQTERLTTQWFVGIKKSILQVNHKNIVISNETRVLSYLYNSTKYTTPAGRKTIS